MAAPKMIVLLLAFIMLCMVSARSVKQDDSEPDASVDGEMSKHRKLTFENDDPEEIEIVSRAKDEATGDKTRLHFGLSTKNDVRIYFVYTGKDSTGLMISQRTNLRFQTLIVFESDNLTATAEEGYRSGEDNVIKSRDLDHEHWRDITCVNGTEAGQLHCLIEHEDDLITFVADIYSTPYELGNITIPSSAMKVTVVLNDTQYMDGQTDRFYALEARTLGHHHAKHDNDHDKVGDREAGVKFGDYAFFEWLKVAKDVVADTDSFNVVFQQGDDEDDGGDNSSPMWFTFVKASDNTGGVTLLSWDPELGSNTAEPSSSASMWGLSTGGFAAAVAAICVGCIALVVAGVVLVKRRARATFHS